MLGFYLRPGDNDVAIPALKACLTSCMGTPLALGDSQTFDPATREVLVRFQQYHGITGDGVAGPATFALIGRALGYSGFRLGPLGGLPEWARNLLLNNPASTSLAGIRSDIVVSMYERMFGALTPARRDGLMFLVDKLAADRDVADLRWAVYMLATAKHETRHTFLPIEEDSKGAGHSYGNAVQVKDAAGNSYTNTYYGRGYVQITHKDNYAKLSTALGLGDQLLIHPEKVLEREIAYRIMSYGMRNGTFRTTKLADVINATQCDYYGARDIINGKKDGKLESADLIESHAKKLEIILCAAVPNFLGVIYGTSSGLFPMSSR